MNCFTTARISQAIAKDVLGSNRTDALSFWPLIFFGFVEISGEPLAVDNSKAEENLNLVETVDNLKTGLWRINLVLLDRVLGSVSLSDTWEDVYGEATGLYIDETLDHLRALRNVTAKDVSPPADELEPFISSLNYQINSHSRQK